MTPGPSPTQLRVSILVWGLGGGAFTNIGTLLTRGMTEAGADAELVVLNVKPGEIERFPGVRIHSLGARRAALAIPPLVRYLRERQPDVLLSMPTYMNCLAIASSLVARTNTRIVISEHALSNHAVSRRERAFPWMLRRLYPHADGLVAPSRDIVSDPWLASIFAHRPEAITVIPNPVKLRDRLATSPTGTPATTRQNVDRVVLSVGRLAAVKGYDNLIRVLARLRGEGQPVRLKILGEGAERAQLEQLARDLGVEHYVEMPGFVSDPFPDMQACDVFVMSSRSEGFGLVLVEAMSCGKPVVVTRARGGMPEIVQDQRNGLLVPVDDPVAMANAICLLLANNDLADRLGSAARNDSFQYDPRCISEKYLRFCSLLCEGQLVNSQ